MRNKHDIKSSVSMPLKTPKTKFEVNPTKEQIFPEGLAKILLGKVRYF